MATEVRWPGEGMSFTNAQIVVTNTHPGTYHMQSSERGQHGFAMSSSALRAFDQCPARWKAGYNAPETEAKDFGELLDCIALTPAQFQSRYAIQPATYGPEAKKWNNNAKECRAWWEKQENEGREVVTESEVKKAGDGFRSLMADEIIARFIEDSDRQVWLTANWQDEETGLVVPCKCLIDLVPRKGSEFDQCAGDLKTTRNAAPEPWRRWCFQAGYYIQAAWNLDMLVAATGEDRNTFVFVLLENFPPWQTAKRMLSQDFLMFGRAEIKRMMGLYCRCLQRGEWPGYDDTDEAVQGWTVVQPEPWMQQRQMFAAKYEVEEAV